MVIVVVKKEEERKDKEGPSATSEQTFYITVTYKCVEERKF